MTLQASNYCDFFTGIEMIMESDLTYFWELSIKVGEMTQFREKSENFVFGEKWHWVGTEIFAAVDAHFDRDSSDWY